MDLDRLLNGLNRILSDDFSADEEMANSNPTELTGWTTWLLVCLVRYSAKQQWAAEIVKTRLGLSPEEIGEAGPFAYQQIQNPGLVPGLTDWEYELHGIGCRLTNRITGEVVDTDFSDEVPNQIDVFFFIEWIESLRSPEWPEARLIAYHPSIRTISLTFDELAESYLIQGTSGSSDDDVDDQIQYERVYRLLSYCLPLTEPLDRLADRFDDVETRRNLATLFHDWEFLIAVGDHNEAEAASLRLEKARNERIARLKRQLNDFERASDAMRSLVEMKVDGIDDYLRDALRGVPSSSTIVALDVIGDRNNQRWLPEVYELFFLLKPSDAPPEPAVWERCARILLQANYKNSEVIKALGKAAPSSTGEAAILALEYGSAETRHLFRKALQSVIPYARAIAAASLAILDEDWARDEMVDVLKETADRESTSECRAALRESRFKEAQTFVDDWERNNPGEEPAWRHDASEWIRYEMQTLHDRILPLRGRKPLI